MTSLGRNICTETVISNTIPEHQTWGTGVGRPGGGSPSSDPTQAPGLGDLGLYNAAIHAFSDAL